ncbi:hypothetical protein SpiGrapes_0977 [Sphaerochaeta pleomorpha str. Grapes]|uniref:Glycogen debranching enzyme n=1 Tax=Sphaerochaeta pleomorpha (strain ATCC BAA-1885 / DSM 22778 / Grapes) TaxID=158190 RepID=G8QRE9_SPHPG|nr:glycoside hydrolase family 125 protein [Sphaerochaeta pleomorpha]AEV28802.1 hypothetical protein SpiGrapes_0977 [Sphaerochaeta pleomorpha str. Grapes]
MKIERYPTGNEYISLPQIETRNAGIKDITFLHMGSKGLLDLRGTENHPFMVPRIKIGGALLDLASLQWKLLDYWIPSASLTLGNGFSISITIYAPVGHRGFVYGILVQNNGRENLDCTVSLQANWGSLYHCINEEKQFEGTLHAYSSSWTDGPVFDIRHGFPLLAFAPISSQKTKWSWEERTDGLSFSSEYSCCLLPGAADEISWFCGFGYEEVAAVTSAREMQRWTTKSLLQDTRAYLQKCLQRVADKRMEEVLNRNLFYALFFATGKTIDSEERVVVTTRSPLYYVSASYWDRDSLLWALPSIICGDASVAREILEYVSTRQARNVGIHSRYIDGTVLEPGFELDELCAPVLGFDSYIRATGDRAILQEGWAQHLFDRIEALLSKKKNSKLQLYETFLQPTDDMHVHPYLTYDNVLVWKLFTLFSQWDYAGKSSLWREEAKIVKHAIYDHCIREGQFVWSVAEDGAYDIYDEPPGSLMLLPTFGFCSLEDPNFKKSVATITDPSYRYSFAGYPFGSIGCPHAPHPWVLSLANSIRVFHDKAALQKLLAAPMDNGIACESIDETTGLCTTGEAFATCSGYVAYVLLEENAFHA